VNMTISRTEAAPLFLFTNTGFNGYINLKLWFCPSRLQTLHVNGEVDVVDQVCEYITNRGICTTI